MQTSKFIFVSNYINHHQIPICNELYRLLGGSFAFCQTEEIEEERLSMGWANERPEYVVCYYENPKKYQEWIDTCEVVFFGGTDEESYIQRRLSKNKPVIRYSERLYKTGQWKAVSPRGLRKKYLDHTKYRKQDVYMLCAGAYVPSDFSIVRAYPGKMLRWGYFPEIREHDVEQLLANKKAGSILWAARFIDWKHPELPIELASYLKEKGYEFHLDMIGTGGMLEAMKALAATLQVEDKVTFHGPKTPAEVRECMEDADIYLITSDRQEGWGAVLNEAMNSGCAVIANHMIGAAPYMISQGKNGLLYKDGDKQMLFSSVEKLLRDREFAKTLGKAGCETVTALWNPHVAAKRLVGLAIRLGFLKPGDALEVTDWQEIPEEGPCSITSVIPERIMWNKLTKR